MKKVGYHSDVALTLSSKCVEALEIKIKNSRNSYKSALCSLLEKADEKGIDKSTGDKCWHWNWIKWYHDYPEICMLEEFISSLDYDEYLFIKIGEDMNDTDVYGSYYENPFGMYLHHSIEFDQKFN